MSLDDPPSTSGSMTAWMCAQELSCACVFEDVHTLGAWLTALPHDAEEAMPLALCCVLVLRSMTSGMC